MAFETNLIAISWLEGNYKVHSHIIGHVNVSAMKEAKLFHDVTDANGTYVDEAAILSKEGLEIYLHEPKSHWAQPATDWYKGLPKEVAFIMVHQAEWESGLGD